VPKKQRRSEPSQASRAGQRKRYQHPIPDRQAILGELARQGVPLSLDTLADTLSVDEASRSALRRRLHRMAASGQLLINRRRQYCLVEKLDAVVGKVSAHSDGFGFLIPDQGGEDVYLPYQEMRSLLDGDKVAVRVGGSDRRGRPAGAVVDILSRGKTTVVGRYQREHGVGYVLESGRSPHQFLVPDHQRKGARNGQLVKLEITEYPDKRREAQGKVVRVLGESTDPAMITEVAIEQHALPDEFPSKVIAAAAEWGERVRPADKADREDLRELPLVTIDGADARDFDDAVYAEAAGDGWRLIVAIADVSHYVAIDSIIDTEARRRGTSVYFPDRVIPMLPESLSNGLCSLNPKVDRLCMVCDMHIGADGKPGRARFYRGLMRSAARLTYEQVDHYQRERKGSAAVRRVGEQIDTLYDLFRALAKARRRRGALDLDLPEVRVDLDDEGLVSRIAPRFRNDAHRLIEECMIAANVQAAKFLRRHRLATLYRVHAGPTEEKFEELRTLLQELGIKVPDQAVSEPRHLNKALAQIDRRPDADQLKISVLRSLSQAVYQPANIGHYGLALNAYAHFTSPIRRYPDLLVHRGIGHVIDKKKPGAFVYDAGAMEQEGKRCSEQERRADDATRDVEAKLKATWLLDRLGQVLPGTVTGVTHFGLFVTLDDLFVDGLVHVTALGRDYFHLTDGGLRLAGERSGVSYALGDAVSVEVLRVDVDEAKIDFALAETGAARTSRRRRRGRRG
jgi:ribonuclease R